MSKSPSAPPIPVAREIVEDEKVHARVVVAAVTSVPAARVVDAVVTSLGTTLGGQLLQTTQLLASPSPRRSEHEIRRAELNAIARFVCAEIERDIPERLQIVLDGGVVPAELTYEMCPFNTRDCEIITSEVDRAVRPRGLRAIARFEWYQSQYAKSVYLVIRAL